MAYCKELTKQLLIDMGIKVSEEKDENGNYKVFRTWRPCKNAKVSTYPVNYFLDAEFNKWSGNTMYYYKVMFSYKMKTYTYSLHRLYYAWFKGCAPEGMVIDHINDKTLENDINNLQPLSYKDSIAKRKGYKNQYQTPRWKKEKNAKN